MPLPDEPNVTLPLATSVTERGVAGFTHSVTNSEDQRKLNCMYEPVKNPLTGKGSLDLVKRPGVSINASTFGSSSQASYLLIAGKNASITGNPMVFSTINAGADITASIVGQTTTLAAATAGYLPWCADKTKLSGSEYIVLQARNSTGGVQRVFYSNDASNVTWAEITDADFTALVHRGKMEHLDGFAFILDHINAISNSDSNSLANWTAGNFITKSIRQDFPVGLARLKNQLLAFCSNTVEMFYNANNGVGSPLGRITQLSQDIGLVDTATGGVNYYATIVDKIYFVGRKAGGLASIGVFAYDGNNFDKVSSVYVDKILNQKAASIYSVFSFAFMGQEAVAVNYTSPDSTSHRWLMFFHEWKEWFEWSSDIFSPTNSGAWFLGISSGNKHRVYEFTASDNWQDNATSYQWFTQFRLPSNGSSRNVLNMYGVDADTARSANDLTVEISRDDCQTFETLGTIDLTQDRKVLFRGGAFRKAHIRLGNTNAVETRLHNFVARVNG